MRYPSKITCIEALGRLFGDPVNDTLTSDEIYRAASRDLSNPKQNERWLANRLTPLKYYGFVKPIYTNNSPRMGLHKVQLTLEEKNALESPSEPPFRSITLESIAQDIREFEQQNPSIELIFSTTIRGHEPKK